MSKRYAALAPRGCDPAQVVRACEHLGRSCATGIIVSLIAIVAAIAACGGDDASGSGVSDDECALVELDTRDSAIDIAGELGGETVADTEIHYTDGDDSVSLGRLDVTMPMLADLDYYYDPQGRDITTPPSWPTLARVQLHSDADPSWKPHHRTRDVRPDHVRSPSMVAGRNCSTRTPR